MLKDRLKIDESLPLEDILNGMFDWVRVLDRNDIIIYTNRAMQDALGCNPSGKKCYSLLNRTEPCENCISRKSVFDGESHEKEEIISDRYYSVMSSPVRNASGDIAAVVEVLRDITNVRSMQKKILEQNMKLKDNLEIAKKLQCSLLPKSLSQSKIEFSFVYRPCETLGGDFVDIFNIDEDHTGVYIADVSGHGVSASMLTVFLRSSINKKTLSPAEALKELFVSFNNYGFDQDLYITVFYGVINHSKKVMKYSNAGHNVCPIVFGPDKFIHLDVPGIPISNWSENPQYADKSVSLETHDRIFLCTDGIIELRNESKEQYSEERLLQILLNDNSMPAGVLNRIAENAVAFSKTSDYSDISDDITMA
ncbi:MAG: SpoIIE family protein phosphatase, partial [Bacillota bacterium]|nr:SpoIIE family protein phosphatase [Bacillota bacterium]